PADLPPPATPKYWEIDRPPTELGGQRGRLQLLGRHQLDLPTDLLLLSRDEELLYVLSPKSRMIVLPAGEYQLSGLFATDSCWQMTVRVDARGLAAYVLNDSLRLPLPTNWQTELEPRRRWTRPSGHLTTARIVPQQQFTSNGSTLTGQITDSEGEPLIGAAVLIKGTTVGTVTDLNGFYKLRVPNGSVDLVISYTGFETREVIGVSRNELNAVMEEGVHLEEVVVTGSIIQRRRKAIGLAVQSTKPTLSGQLMGVQTQGQLVPVTEINPEEQSLAPIDGGLANNDTDSSTDTRLRSNFSDYAYWQPYLLTDREGVATFSAQFPDDITNWRHFAIGLDERGRMGVGGGYTQSYLPVQAQLYTPRFLLTGDQGSVIGLLNNRTPDSVRVRSWLTLPDGQQRQRQTVLTSAQRDYFDLPKVSPDADSIRLTYQLLSQDFRDGEQRAIPVFRRGMERKTGGFLALRDDQLTNISVDPQRGPVQLQIGGNALPQLLTAIGELRDYEHYCNEQTASRLLALLAAEQLPEQYREQTTYAPTIRRLIQRLRKHQRTDGSWGWWKASPKGSIWITCHVIKALEEAAAMGYTIPDLSTAISYLLTELEQSEKQPQLDLLHFFAERDQPLDYAFYLQRFDDLERNLSSELTYRRIQQLADLPYHLDSLLAWRKTTLTGAHFWGQKQHWYSPVLYQPTRSTLLAYQLLREADVKVDLAAIQQFFLEPIADDQRSRTLSLGRNTYEKSLLIQTLLADVLQENTPLQVQYTLGKQATTVRDFPTQTTLSTDEVSFKKMGDGPAFVSYYQSYWDEDPKASNAGFALRQAFLQGGRAVQQLQTDEPTHLKTTVKLAGAGEYVLVEIPVPAGCSYGDKVFKEHPGEVHREYLRDRVAIYCTYLPAGEHTFTVPLVPRYPGRYYLNPAHAELMYRPGINGYTAGRYVTIRNSDK
ncbi:MAG: carboxypeptidase-like regulatory domain-containing protein, partial [Bacteroidota bacterium]